MIARIALFRFLSFFSFFTIIGGYWRGVGVPTLPPRRGCTGYYMINNDINNNDGFENGGDGGRGVMGQRAEEKGRFGDNGGWSWFEAGGNGGDAGESRDNRKTGTNLENSDNQFLHRCFDL